MEQLNSSTNFFRKIIFPIILLAVSTFAVILFIKMEFWIGIVIILLGFTILIGILKNFYWDLKQVFLDEINKQLIVGKDKILIKFEEIESVELVKILSIVVVVKLKSEINGMSDFTFVPKNYFLYESPIVEKLKKLIQNGTAGNSRLAQWLVLFFLAGNY